MQHRLFTGTLGAIALVVSSAWVSGSAHALTFVPPPGGNAPSQATGGASRGTVNFLPPSSQGAPSQATGGASRGTVNFLPPSSQGTPSQATGGASRGNLFAPSAGSGAPQGSVGGASRGQVFTPASGNGTPQQASGGASRGQVFTPASGNGTPQQASGGASRGQVFTPASGSGTPQQAAGGASREGTYVLNASTTGAGGTAAILALLPQSYFGTTVSERPTILVYLPASTAQEVMFSLKDQAGKLKYQTTLPVSGAAGIIAIALPAEAPALDIGAKYQWFLALKVDGHLTPNTPYVDGWVQRIQPSAALATALQQPDAMKRATALGAQGVWYDCVATLAMLRTTQPNSAALAKDWSDLLVAVGLQDIKQASIALSAK